MYEHKVIGYVAFNRGKTGVICDGDGCIVASSETKKETGSIIKSESKKYKLAARLRMDSSIKNKKDDKYYILC